MDYSKHSNSQYNYGQYPPGYTDSYAQIQHQQQPNQYQPTPPQIRNPFAPPPVVNSSYNGHNASFDPEYDAQLAQWRSAYITQDSTERGGNNNAKTTAGETAIQNATTSTRAGAGAHPDGGPTAAPLKTTPEESNDTGKKKTVVRNGGGQTWEDSTLLEWDPTQFRIMVGNLAGEVTDDSLAKAFAQYGVSKARVVRDKRTTKSRGYGFVAFTDGEMGFKAAREMTGKYIGNHPVTIQRSKTDLRPTAQKDKYKGKHNNNKNKNGGGGKAADPLRAHTAAHIEKKPVRNPNRMKMLG